MENIDNNVNTNVHPNQAVECCKAFLANYKNFSGRARRSEYWWPMLAIAIVSSVLSILAGIPKIGVIFSIASALFSLAVLVPSLAVISRRLHDTGRAFGWFFITFVPVVGGILFLIWMIKDSEPGENRFGANPKNA